MRAQIERPAPGGTGNGAGLVCSGRHDLIPSPSEKQSETGFLDRLYDAWIASDTEETFPEGVE